MTRVHRKTTDERLYAAAEVDFTHEGGTPLSMHPEAQRQMSEYDIGRAGHAYEYKGYRYDRLSDAVAYAALMRSRPDQRETHGTVARHAPAPPETASEIELMRQLGIEIRGSSYCFRGYRYGLLSDAVNYARAQTHRPESAG